jgi:ribulose-phosphate 3-epimerase
MPIQPNEIQIAPSILSADFARLGEQVGAVLDAGAQLIHVDVMDGHFVPPITMGPIVVQALREALGDGPYIDVHLMIERPEGQITPFASAGASGITIHAEATPNVHYALAAIRDAGCRSGLAVSPATPPDVFAQVREELDLALCMTVNPGWGGQSFLPAMLAKTAAIRELVGTGVEVEVDGGVDRATVADCVRAGAGWLVAGSAVFGAQDPAAAFTELRRLAGARG